MTHWKWPSRPRFETSSEGALATTSIEPPPTTLERLLCDNAIVRFGRVEVARALVGRPQMLLLGEPDVAWPMGHKNVFIAKVCRDHAGVYLDWKGLQLCTERQAIDGSEVGFCIAADDALLTDDSRNPAVNILDAHIERAIPVGPTITLHARLENGERLVLTAPKHVLVKRGVAVGEAVRIKLSPCAVEAMLARGSSTWSRPESN